MNPATLFGYNRSQNGHRPIRPIRPVPILTPEFLSSLITLHFSRFTSIGLLHAIHYSRRKVRFDLNEIESFAATGMTDIHS